MIFCENCEKKIGYKDVFSPYYYGEKFCSENCLKTKYGETILDDIEEDNDEVYLTSYEEKSNEIFLSISEKEKLFWDLTLLNFEPKYNFLLIPYSEKKIFLKELIEDEGIKNFSELLNLRRKEVFSPLYFKGEKVYIYFHLYNDKNKIFILHNKKQNIR